MPQCFLPPAFHHGHPMLSIFSSHVQLPTKSMTLGASHVRGPVVGDRDTARFTSLSSRPHCGETLDREKRPITSRPRAPRPTRLLSPAVAVKTRSSRRRPSCRRRRGFRYLWMAEFGGGVVEVAGRPSSASLSSPLLHPHVRPEMAVPGRGDHWRAASPPGWSGTGASAVVRRRRCGRSAHGGERRRCLVLSSSSALDVVFRRSDGESTRAAAAAGCSSLSQAPTTSQRADRASRDNQQRRHIASPTTAPCRLMWGPWTPSPLCCPGEASATPSTVAAAEIEGGGGG
jgi:hypothetical protein